MAGQPATPWLESPADTHRVPPGTRGFAGCPPSHPCFIRENLWL